MGNGGGRREIYNDMPMRPQPQPLSRSRFPTRHLTADALGLPASGVLMPPSPTKSLEDEEGNTLDYNSPESESMSGSNKSPHMRKTPAHCDSSSPSQNLKISSKQTESNSSS